MCPVYIKVAAQKIRLVAIPAGSTVAGRKLPAADRLGILSVWMEAVPVETVPVEAGDLGPEAPPGISPDKLGTCSRE